jgi:hypothetical protein
MFMERATIAVCDVAPPRSVTNAGERMLAEEDHVRGRKVARHEDGGILAHGLHRDAPLGARECRQDALGHLPHVILALLQIRVLDVAELGHQLVQLRAQRPFRVAALLADDVARRLRQCGIVQQHHVHLHEGRQLRGRAVRHALLQLGQLVAHFLHRAVVAALLAQHVRPRRSRSDRPPPTCRRKGARARWRCPWTRRCRAS